MFNTICVVGAGAIGGWIAARLARLNCDVCLLARGATLAAIQARGLRLQEGGAAGSGGENCALVRASSDPRVLAAAGPPDLVIIALKAPALAPVAPTLVPLLGPNTTTLTTMNGVPWWFLHGIKGPLANQALTSVDPGGQGRGTIANTIELSSVIGGVVHASCSQLAPGVIVHHAGNGLILGEPSGARSERLVALGQLLKRAGFEVTLSSQIQADIWYKLWGNMTINPVCMLTGVTADKILADDEARGFISAVMHEAAAIGAALGLPSAGSVQERHQITSKLGALVPSMVQDAQAGKPIELDALVGAVRELGLKTSVPTPFTDALFGLSRVYAREKGLY